VYTKVFELRVPVPVEKVWELYQSPSALETLSRPSDHVRVLNPEVGLKDGVVHKIRMRKFGIPITWHARISQVTPPYGFTDQAERSPFKFWRHRHDFIPDGEGTLIRDVVAYEMPFGKLGKALHKLIVEKDLTAGFAHRDEATKRALMG